MSVEGGPDIVTDGLVLYLDAGNNRSIISGSNTWFDLSRNSNTGSLINGPAYSSTNGGSIVFDGTDDWVTIPPGSNFAYGTGDFTVEAWAKPNLSITTTYGGVIYSQVVSGTNYFIWGVNPTSDPKTYFIATVSGGGTAVNGPNYIPGAWNHIVFSRISGVIYSYTNIIAGATQNNSANLTNTTYVPTIGDETHHGGNDPYAGHIGSIRIYKGKGLTFKEVRQNYHATKGRYGL